MTTEAKGTQNVCTHAERDCKHGQLARSCNVCELESEVARQAAEIEQVRSDRDSLYKDWEDTFGQRSFGEVAAEIERLKATPPDKREDLRCVIADLTRQCQESDALLRQASELLHRQWSCSAVWSLEEAQDLDAAIKQHLGEQT